MQKFIKILLLAVLGVIFVKSNSIAAEKIPPKSYNEAAKMFDKGVVPELNSTIGWFPGRCVWWVDNRILPSIIVGEMRDESLYFTALTLIINDIAYFDNLDSDKRKEVSNIHNNRISKHTAAIELERSLVTIHKQTFLFDIGLTTNQNDLLIHEDWIYKLRFSPDENYFTMYVRMIATDDYRFQCYYSTTDVSKGQN